MLRTISGSSRHVVHRVSDTKVDFLFAVTSDEKGYMIPVDVINTKSELTLTNEYNKYEV